MSEGASAAARVAVFKPLRRVFEYLIPTDLPGPPVAPGARVEVPFSGRQVCGIVLSVTDQPAMPAAKLKALRRVLGPHPCCGGDLLRLAGWAARYYQFPIGEVLAAALPAPLRTPHEPSLRQPVSWQAAPGAPDPDALPANASRQRVLLERLARGPLGEAELADFAFEARAALKRLVTRGWVTAAPCAAPERASNPSADAVRLTAEQARVTEALEERLGAFSATLLEGVTGSGKTEVYLALAAETIAAGGQVLVLVPEIGLTHALIGRFRERFGARVAVYHSGLPDSERYRQWLAARAGDIDIVLGTRSAVWLPFVDLSLIVVDEEHDESYKQQEGFRYSARDTAVMRGRMADVPVLLGSATPSLESLANVERGKYAHARLAARALGAELPSVELVDVRGQTLEDGLGPTLIGAIDDTLAAGQQVLIFVNRRGFAPTVLCRECGTAIECRRCSAPLVYHQRANAMRCHHCGLSTRLEAPCGCGDQFEAVFLGSGTERVYEALCRRYPEHRVQRIDRDSVRSESDRSAFIEDMRAARIDIAVGTRMIAKGHHFPNVTLVGITDADARLFSTDFRAPERLAQTVVQVAGRAGRDRLPGRVLIQTRNPGHPLLQTLLREGYDAAAREMLALREQTELPPFTMFVLLRADSREEARALEFLDAAAGKLAAVLTPEQGSAPALFGPFSAPLVRKAGYFRAQLIVQVPRRAGSLAALDAITATLEDLKVGSRVRWSVDVDPIEMG